MATMNPYYAHESSVGPVFDVAHYSRFKAAVLALTWLGFATFVGLGAAYSWNPDWIISQPHEVFANAHREAKGWLLEHPWGVKTGVAMAGMFTVLAVAAGGSCLVAVLWGNFYVRAGEGGLSLRVPDLFVGALERDLPWSDIENLTVVQEKWLGSLSQSSGNIGGELRLRTHDGWSRDVRLDHFREDAWLIYQRIEEARETRAAVLA
jgi:hypothetical protein